MKSARRVVTIGKRPIHAEGERATKPAREQGRRPTAISPPIVESDFTELEDGSLVEMVEDPNALHRTKLVVFKNGTVRLVDKIKSRKQILRPFPRESEFLKHIRLPRGIQPHTSVASLLCRINEEIFSRCLDMEDDHKFLLACFVLSTWFIDSEHMPIAPYLALVGLPGSGKSTVLKILRLLCRRALLTADLSAAAFYRACEQFTPTLLIDETLTAGDKAKLFHLLRIGNSRDTVSLRKDESFTAYGAKAFAWNELPGDAALNSRCIVIPMHEARRTGLARPSDPDIIAAADDIQKQLLWYRLQGLKTQRHTQTIEKANLTARPGDLYEALAVALGDDMHYRKWLLGCCKDQKRANQEPLPPREAAVLHTLFKVIHSSPWSQCFYPVLKLTFLVNADLKQAGQRLQLTAKSVGVALSCLGIGNRRRTNQGWVVTLDLKLQERIHRLVESYGLDSDYYLPSQEETAECDLCDQEKDVRNYSLAPIPRLCQLLLKPQTIVRASDLQAKQEVSIESETYAPSGQPEQVDTETETMSFRAWAWRMW